MATYRCPACGYEYDEQAGEPREGFPAGTPMSDVPRRLDLPRLRRARGAGLREGGLTWPLLP